MEFVTLPEQRTQVPKGWGKEDWLWNEEYCGKILYFLEGICCSWHYHALKDEVLYLQSGSVLVKYSYGDDITQAQEVFLTPGNAFHVPTGLRHRIIALEESYIFEFSTHH